MKNFFLIIAAFSFLLTALIGYIRENPLADIVGRSVLAYCVIFFLGTVIERLGTPPAAEEKNDAARPEDRNGERKNREGMAVNISRDPEKVAQIIRKMI